MIRVSRVMAAVSAACAVVLIAGCSSVIEGRAVSPLYDPFRAGGLPAADGPSGVRDNAPAPTGDITDGDGGDIDKLALLSINDIAEFWEQNYSGSLPGSFTAIDRLMSYDSHDRSSPTICGTETYDNPNAFYCPSKQIMAWDRGVLVPNGTEVLRRRRHRGVDGPRVRARRATHGEPRRQVDAGGRVRTAGRLLRRYVRPLGGRGQVAALLTEHRRRPESRARRCNHTARPGPGPAGHRNARTGARHRAGPGQRIPDGVRQWRAGMRQDRPRRGPGTARRPADGAAARARPATCRAAT